MMNSTTQIPFKTSRRLHQHGIIPFDPLDAIDEAVVCENNSQPVFNLTASQRRVLEAAVYVVPEPDLGRNMNNRCFEAALSP